MDCDVRKTDPHPKRIIDIGSVQQDGNDRDTVRARDDSTRELVTEHLEGYVGRVWAHGLELVCPMAWLICGGHETEPERHIAMQLSRTW